MVNASVVIIMYIENPQNTDDSKIISINEKNKPQNNVVNSGMYYLCMEM